MNTIRYGYQLFCRLEEILVGTMILGITVLIFSAALGRFAGQPLNWANDVALLLFAWLTFLGADVALKRSEFMRVEILVSRFPEVVRKGLYTVFSVATVGFLLVVVAEGVPLAMDNAQRLFQTLGISYLWATLSAPVGGLLISVTIVLQTIQMWRGREAQNSTSEVI